MCFLASAAPYPPMFFFQDLQGPAGRNTPLPHEGVRPPTSPGWEMKDAYTVPLHTHAANKHNQKQLNTIRTN